MERVEEQAVEDRPDQEFVGQPVLGVGAQAAKHQRAAGDYEGFEEVWCDSVGAAIAG